MLTNGVQMSMAYEINTNQYKSIQMAYENFDFGSSFQPAPVISQFQVSYKWWG